MPLEEITEQEAKKYEDIVSQLDKREIGKTYGQSYRSENDGGVKGLLDKAYSQYSANAHLSVDINDPDTASQAIDNYLENVLATFEPEKYQAMKDTLDSYSPEQRRGYVNQLAASYLGVPAQAIEQGREQAHSRITESGNVGEGLEQLENIFKHPTYGIANSKANKALTNELSDHDSATKLVQYVNEHMLKPRGYSIDDTEAQLIAADQRKTQELVTAAVNGQMDPYLRNRYNIQEQ